MFLWQRIKSFIETRKIRKEGGDKTSTLIRKITENRYNVTVGMYSYGSCFDKAFNTGGKVVIGRYTSFGPNVRYYGANHPMNRVSMSPYFYQQSWADTQLGGVKVQDVNRSTLTVGNDCWVGSGTIITSGCKKIGNGAVVGAGSIVTKDVEPYTVVAGNPATVIRKRFPQEMIIKLEESRWYELTPDVLLQYYDRIDNPIHFAEAVMQYREKQCE